MNCDECGKRITDNNAAPDTGASHNFCCHCLDLLELGQGLVEDTALELAGWKEAIRDTDAKEAHTIADTVRRVANVYADTVGCPSPFRTNWRNPYRHV
jgi:hypothetical protein